jgi:two-component sensor histidine kinase
MNDDSDTGKREAARQIRSRIEQLMVSYSGLYTTDAIRFKKSVDQLRDEAKKGNA